MSDQTLTDAHALMITVDGNRSQEKYVDGPLLEGQSTKEYSPNNFFPIDSYKSR